MDLLSLSPVIVFGIIMSALARRKGYRWLYWFYASGLIGLFVLAFLPFANKPDQTPEERARLVRRGNKIGLALTAIAVVVTLVMFGFYLHKEYGLFE